MVVEDLSSWLRTIGSCYAIADFVMKICMTLVKVTKQTTALPTSTHVDSRNLLNQGIGYERLPFPLSWYSLH